MTLVFSGGKGTLGGGAAEAAISLREFCSQDVEATVREKSFTYDRRKDVPFKSGAWRGATYMTKRGGRNGEPCGTPTETGAGRFDRKDPSQETR